MRLLNAHNARYLVVGGYAVAIHGHPRYTGDLDVFVDATPENATAVVAAFREFGFDVPGLKPELFTTPDNVVRIGVEPVRLEVLSSISGVRFTDAYPRRMEVPIGNLSVPFISYEDLLKNKSSTGRTKDLADVEALKKRTRK